MGKGEKKALLSGDSYDATDLSPEDAFIKNIGKCLCECLFVGIQILQIQWFPMPIATYRYFVVNIFKI
jgi:hypothetical protein